jgi:hypothetical protein
VAVGEHLGFLCTGAWTFLIAAALSKTGFIRPWLAVLGMVLAVGIVLGVFEVIGWAFAGPVVRLAGDRWGAVSTPEKLTGTSAQRIE